MLLLRCGAFSEPSASFLLKVMHYNSAVEIDAFLRCTGYIQASSKRGDVMACENTGGGQM